MKLVKEVKFPFDLYDRALNLFAVSPLNTRGNYVHPVARDFMDFLRLLLTCGDAAVMEQVFGWDQAEFDTFLQDNPLTAEQQSVLDAIRENLLLAPMERPFAYIKELQAEFDYSLLIYREDYNEWVSVESKIPEWKVYYNGNFWGHHGRARAGKEIPLDKQFVWDDKVFLIPSIYTCNKGLIVDFCLKVPTERIRYFIDKWNLSIENDRSDFTAEQQMQIDAENPLDVDISLKVVLNGTVLSGSHGCGVSWNPCLTEGNGLEARSVIRHYGLDHDYGWVIRRAAFPWKTKRKPQIKSLSVTLIQRPVALSGPHFHVSAPGEQIEFTHPTTGLQHTLTVQEYEQQEILLEHFGSQNQEFPTHYTVMSYTLLPDLPDNAFSVTDCVRSDQLRQKYTNINEPQASSSGFCFGISSDCPTAIIFGGSGQGKLQAACSALHFEPVDKVEWRMVFYEKRHDDVTVELI
ncbi:hypothetical protein Desor_2753 [Desulfosporosinus orientis DSM 765]|uniref:Phage tail protein n=1 Tax=Desulfosporosinus orientis (strain ATCC 19365 / DSM 765 / NCIMB 8382 / VKM B-1628 / Singapore I) TaxID=768706 RepID=G7WBG4_DESOD|nr:hypothetical protein [Desulfosporosinus orientis]AET68293.1 hypothetical protein Desor_2753 [Desulfosporosinus orientis DSM 765]